MRRVACLLVPVLTLTLAVAPVRAASTPVINVKTFGLELCPQSICGAAIFAGFLVGQVGQNPNAVGTFIVAANFDGDLPDGENPTIGLTGGVFELRVGLRRFRGVIVEGEGSTLTFIGGDKFLVRAELQFTSGATGTAQYEGILDHTVFPPTVIGEISQ